MGNMKHVVLFICGLLFGLFLVHCAARADTVGVHLYTAHWSGNYNNVNTGLYYKTDTGLIAGMYRNSYDRPSAYVGMVVHSGPFEIVGGVVTGYKGVCPKVCKALTPMFVPSLALPLTGSSTLRLSVPNGQGVHLSLEYRL